jgi:hypothetical protein
MHHDLHWDQNIGCKWIDWLLLFTYSVIIIVTAVTDVLFKISHVTPYYLLQIM